MYKTLPLLAETDFPSLTRRSIEILQVNLGYRCNQSCLHCHVNAGPNRKEEMSKQTIDTVISFIDANPSITTLDLTGGAPELNPHFLYLVRQARKRNIRVIDRCNLTILEQPGQENLATFLAEHQVEIVASLPCYLEDNVDKQRGSGVFQESIRGLKQLNALGYGRADSKLNLNLVYNPQGADLPPSQDTLEEAYREYLGKHFGISFNQLFTLANMPIKRFGSMLISKGKFSTYMNLLRDAHQDENLEQVMCKSLLSVDWLGFLYDCDFNQQLGLNIGNAKKPRLHISEVTTDHLENTTIKVADHCYGCTAGQGSSCGGALAE